jgi:hypothetical protein
MEFRRTLNYNPHMIIADAIPSPLADLVREIADRDGLSPLDAALLAAKANLQQSHGGSIVAYRYDIQHEAERFAVRIEVLAHSETHAEINAKLAELADRDEIVVDYVERLDEPESFGWANGEFDPQRQAG